MVAGLGRRLDLADAPEGAALVDLAFPGAALLDRDLGMGARRCLAPRLPPVDHEAVGGAGAEVGQEAERLGAAVAVLVEQLGDLRGVAFPDLERPPATPSASNERRTRVSGRAKVEGLPTSRWAISSGAAGLAAAARAGPGEARRSRRRAGNDGGSHRR